MINPNINKEIASLWHKHFDKYESGKTPVSEEEFGKIKAPMFYDKPKQGGILFVGMNPSFTPKANNILKKEYPEEIKNPSEYYLWNNTKNNEEKINRMIEIEKKWLEKYPSYFKPMIEITNSIELKNKYFQHIDLFIYRETNQPNFIEKIYIKGELNEFGKDQMEIFDKVLNSLSPEVIVVANAKASKIFKQEYKMDDKMNKSTGFYFKGEIPIFFSGMLSGRRALDIHSRERLIWHIKKSISP
jgi:hypothetical protein